MKYSIQELAKINDELAERHPQDILQWVNDEFGSGELVLSTGFGSDGVVLIDMLTRVNRDIDIFYLDTGVLFDETYRFKERLEERYSIRIKKYESQLTLEQQATLYGDKLWNNDPDKCCTLRKVEPLRRALEPYSGWITAIRREQSPVRRDTQTIEWNNRHGLYKIHPLAYWKRTDVWRYIRENNLPYNPLHDMGYPSIGCYHCTTPVANGEDERAGRWRGNRKTECGLHLRV
jgi:phosphoadenosine phosphosulfate reductase